MVSPKQQAIRAYNTGDLSTAARLCRKSLKASPDDPEVLCLLGTIKARQGDLQAAVPLFERGVDLAPGNPMLHNSLAKALAGVGRNDATLHHFRRSVELAPTNALAHYDLGCALMQQEQFAEAAACFEHAVALDPNRADALHNLGSALRQQGRHAEAVDCFRRALGMQPRLVEARVNLGLTLQELGQLDQATRELQQAIAQTPNDPNAHLNLALCHLLRGDFEQGWAEYAWRWRCPDKVQRPYRLPEWAGEELAGRSLLVYAEQGIGDEIMFASCIPDLLRSGARLTLDCEPRLASLFRRSFPQARVMAMDQLQGTRDLGELSDLGCQIAAGNLPRHLRRRFDHFPSHAGYLQADSERVAWWRNRYRQDMGTSLAVGISWRGGGTPLVRQLRSIPLLRWQPILQTPGVTFVNLQYGDCREEILATERETGVRIHDWREGDPLTDLDDCAAKICALDLVISIDNSTVHLAGALGVRTWTLLPYVPDWRWMLDRDDSPWYPAMRLYRQPQPGDWDSVIARVAGELARTGKP